MFDVEIADLLRLLLIKLGMMRSRMRAGPSWHFPPYGAAKPQKVSDLMGKMVFSFSLCLMDGSFLAFSSMRAG